MVYKVVSGNGYVRVFAPLVSGEWFKWYGYSLRDDLYPTSDHVMYALAA